MNDPDLAPGDGQAGNEPAHDEPPHLDESVRRIGAAGKASMDSALETGRALRKLVSVDLALARSAFGRALAWVAVAIVFGASAWLLLMGAAIALLRALGWSWLASMVVCAVISLAAAVFASWRVSRFFDYTGLHATRRQLARLGFADDIDDSDDVSPTPPPQHGTGPA